MPNLSEKIRELASIGHPGNNDCSGCKRIYEFFQEYAFDIAAALEDGYECSSCSEGWGSVEDVWRRLGFVEPEPTAEERVQVLEQRLEEERKARRNSEGIANVAVQLVERHPLVHPTLDATCQLCALSLAIREHAPQKP